jgi:hypothetical protein
MSKRNIECSLKYCKDCKVRLHQGNCREESDYVVLTRKCPQCGKSVHIIEVLKEDYNNSVEALNRIIDFIAEKKG